MHEMAMDRNMMSQPLRQVLFHTLMEELLKRIQMVKLDVPDDALDCRIHPQIGRHEAVAQRTIAGRSSDLHPVEIRHLHAWSGEHGIT